MTPTVLQSEEALLSRIKKQQLVESVEHMSPVYLEGMKRILTVSADTELISAPAYYHAAVHAPSLNTFGSAISIIQDELSPRRWRKTSVPSRVRLKQQMSRTALRTSVNSLYLRPILRLIEAGVSGCRSSCWRCASLWVALCSSSPSRPSSRPRPR